MSGERQQNNILSFLKDIWKGGQEGNKKKNYFLLALLALGIILMFSSSFFTPQKKAPTYIHETAEQAREPSLTVESYENELTKSLQLVLEQINGISHVHVFISFETSEELIFAQVKEGSIRETMESDREGGVRTINETSHRHDYVILREAGGGERPLLISENMPRVSGILVVAKGAENIFLRLEVVRAIQSLLNLPVHRIAVLPHGD